MLFSVVAVVLKRLSWLFEWQLKLSLLLIFGSQTMACLLVLQKLGDGLWRGLIVLARSWLRGIVAAVRALTTVLIRKFAPRFRARFLLISVFWSRSCLTSYSLVLTEFTLDVPNYHFSTFLLKLALQFTCWLCLSRGGEVLSLVDSVFVVGLIAKHSSMDLIWSLLCLYCSLLLI